MAEEDLGGPNAVPIGRAAAAAAAALVLQHHHHQQQQQHAVADVKTEPASPSSSEATHTSHTSTLMENGVNGGVYSEDSLDQTDHTDTEDAPLDFSIKRRDRDDGDRDRDRDSGWERERERETGGSPRGAHNLTGSHHHNFTQGDGQTAVNGTPSPALSPVSVTEAGEVHAEHKIGEPQIAFPGMIPGTAIPGLSAAGLMPGFPLGMMPNAGALMGALPFLEQQQRRTSPGGSVSPGGSSSKNTRPFKAYPKDPLSLPLGYHGIASLPGVSPVPNIDVAAAQALTQNSEEMFKQYREYVLKMQTQLRQQRSNNKQNGRINNSRRSSESSGSASPALSQGTSTTNGVIPLTTTTTSSPATSSTPSRKRGRSLPDEQKDEAYWERRRKNNDAAKRSRDTRRAKEDEIAIRAAFLEQENLKLRVELAALKNETAKLRCMLYNS